MPLHRDSTLENIHRHHRWEENNQAGLDALVPDALDIHKVAYKKDDDTYHVLKSVSPTIWVQTAYAKAKTDELLGLKQDTLVSGTNIKTINGQSVLGSGDLVISGGGAADLSGYYKKTETYSKVEVDTKIDTIPATDLSGYYKKTETYSKAQVDALVAGGSAGGIVEFSSLTPEQREMIRGPQGVKGDIGLTGFKGDTGDQGIQGIQGIQGEAGLNGVGIVSVIKTKTTGLVDTYTITYDDFRTSTFEITNAKIDDTVIVKYKPSTAFLMAYSN